MSHKLTSLKLSHYQWAVSSLSPLSLSLASTHPMHALSQHIAPCLSRFTTVFMASFANYAYWYPLLKDHCPKSIILDSACIQAMLRHCTGSGTVGIRLSTHAPLYSPQSSESEHESETETRCTADTVNRPGHESDSESENESDHDKFEVSQAESYPGELEAIALIEATIQSLGGSVFIKDNMHAPNVTKLVAITNIALFLLATAC